MQLAGHNGNGNWAAEDKCMHLWLESARRSVVIDHVTYHVVLSSLQACRQITVQPLVVLLEIHR